MRSWSERALDVIGECLVWLLVASIVMFLVVSVVQVSR